MKPGRELPNLHAVTVWRPWSEAIVDGVKPVENRVWPPHERFLGCHVAIHGGKTYDDHAHWPAGWIPPPFPGIGIVGVVRIAGALDLRNSRRVILPRVGPALTELERAKLETLDEDPWFVGPVGWFLTEAVRVDVVDIKGARGFWPVPAGVADRVRKSWIDARAKLEVRP
jgi:hypothetical protein